MLFIRTAVFLLLLCSGLSYSLENSQHKEDLPLVFEAEEYSTDIETKITEVQGAVRIAYDGRELRAMKVRIDGNTSIVYSEGEIHYTYDGLSIEAESGEINFKTGVGYFKNAVVQMDEGVYLEGREISRLSESRYRVNNGKFSPCVDCPQAWSLMGAQIDVEVEGYAEAHHAFFQIKDLPIVYLPFIYMPVKTQRQSGLLIPSFRFNGPLGSQFEIPFFWVLGDQTDTTFQYSFMSKGGHRIANEFNYIHSDRSFFQSRISHINNGSVKDVPQNRFGIKLEEFWQLTPRFSQKLDVEWTSDPFYAQNFDSEFTQTELPSLKSHFSLDKKFDRYQLSLGASLYQNNIYRRYEDPVLRKSIHKLPYGQFSYPNFLFFDPLTVDLHVDLLSLRRFKEGLFSEELRLDPQSKWIRTGDRLSPQLSLSMPLSFFNSFLYEPSIYLRYDFYHFNNIEKVDSDQYAHRFRSVFEQKLSTRFWSVFHWNGKKLKKVKHVFQPYLRWSYAPEENRSHHVFFNQCDTSLFNFCFRSPKFDLFDPNADSRSFSLRSFDLEQRLGVHNLLSYGFSSRLLGRWGDKLRKYDEILYLNVAQDFDLNTREEGNLRVNIQANIRNFYLNGDWLYDFRENVSNFFNEVKFRYRFLEFNSFQEFNEDRKLFGGGIRLNNLGPFGVGAELVFEDDFEQSQKESYFLSYLSPSKCWNLNLLFRRQPGSEKFEQIPTFQLSYSEAAAKKTKF